MNGPNWPNPLFPPVVVWDENGRPAWRHCCTDREIHHDQLPLAADRWRITEPGRSISPSLHCTACGTHGWWIGGRWVDTDGLLQEIAERRADPEFAARLDRIRARADARTTDTTEGEPK